MTMLALSPMMQIWRSSAMPSPSLSIRIQYSPQRHQRLGDVAAEGLIGARVAVHALGREAHVAAGEVAVLGDQGARHALA